MSGRHGEWFLSAKGRQIFPFDLRPEDVDIEEIAHALSNLCRFNGHVREFYSVAQHSVLVSLKVPRELALVGLLHDAPEAYLGDMIRPLKRSWLMWGYRFVERRIWRAVAQHFDLPEHLPAEIKAADTRMLQTERRDLLARPYDWEWKEDQIADDSVAPYEREIYPWTPAIARHWFLDRYACLLRRSAHPWTPESRKGVA